ncbi:chemotaxis protein CheX [Oscillospiraceae bacterium PP1C4]
MTNGVFSPFSKATCEVFKLLLDLDVSVSSPTKLDTIVGADDKVNIIIGIIGDLSGEILYRFPKETTLEIVKIMSGMEIDEIDEFVTSALGEIANIISGNAMTGLSEQKVVCDILPPRIIVGDSQRLTEGTFPIMSTRVNTSIGEVELDIQVGAN